MDVDRRHRGRECLRECIAFFGALKFTIRQRYRVKQARKARQREASKQDFVDKESSSQLSRTQSRISKIFKQNSQPSNLEEKGSSNKALFGARLSDRMSVPQLELVSWCIQKIELAEGSDLEGIYRKSGSCAAINELQACFDKGCLPTGDMRTDARCVADLLKRYIRSLPEPLLSKKCQQGLLGDGLLASSPLEDDDDEGNAGPILLAKRAIDRLPLINRNICAVLFRHLGSLSQRESATKMTAESLAKVWAPNIFGSSAASAGLTTSSISLGSRSDIDRQINATKLLIVHHASIFTANNSTASGCAQPQRAMTSSALFGMVDDVSSVAEDSGLPDSTTELHPMLSLASH